MYPCAVLVLLFFVIITKVAIKDIYPVLIIRLSVK